MPIKLHCNLINHYLKCQYHKSFLLCNKNTSWTGNGGYIGAYLLSLLHINFQQILSRYFANILKPFLVKLVILKLITFDSRSITCSSLYMGVVYQINQTGSSTYGCQMGRQVYNRPSCPCWKVATRWHRWSKRRASSKWWQNLHEMD